MKYSEKILNTPSSFIRNILKVTDAPDVISFAGGLPNPISFPIEDLQKSIHCAIEENGAKLFQYSTTEGYLPLRQYIADKYKKDYGLNFNPEDILITTGSQQALQLISQVLVNKGEGIVMEEPGYLGAIQAFTLAEPSFYSVQLKEDGLNVEQLENTLKHNQHIKFIYLVPNFHNPTGITYTKDNREAIYEVIKKYDVVLIEDDPYGELRWSGEKIPYIGAGRLENSVLLGSFSKIVTPGMRIGYMATKNKELMNHVNTAKQATDLHTNIFSQMIIHKYLVNNDLRSHIEKIVQLYKTQAETMLNAIAKYFPTYVNYTKPDGGMFIWVTLPEGTSSLDLFYKAMEEKVAFVPGDPFYTNKSNVNTFRLNYTNTSPEIIEEGIKRLGNILYSLSSEKQTV
ncbi:PLP-dependent aminotransferase family protein [Ureibacillus sp. 179-F W5.1 NHS]|uniref:PLP-dependent aminotransferase family protein n=1 Tax=Lysinibacillus halotolerans TaxID=1368476 RepID=A0A3M8HF46_9BACI|nr:PLP-dependent aminotransferase family protein [Lysinibacillus halotolerans]RND01098.1 PLP-dependent aminotransferase family protein [Lysinibacillus halotolerans]